MRPLLTPEQMAEADRAAIDAGAPSSVLMERAGRAVARAALRVAGGRYGRRAVVVCGKGNNGGDGLVAARVLEREGLSVSCLLLEEPSSLSGSARKQFEKLVAAGSSWRSFPETVLPTCDVVVDALFGIGFRGPVPPPVARAIAAINSAGAPVVAVDIPSGVEAATGKTHEPSVRADVTVTMGAEKLGTALPPGALLAGVVEVADIGIPVSSCDAWLPEPPDLLRAWPIRPPDAHKRSAGSVAVVGGSSGMGGAVALSARAALRAGAGYVTVVTTNEVEPAVAALLPEVLTRAGGTRELDAGALERAADTLERADAVAVGPGLGRGDDAAALVRKALDLPKPLVLDADGLNVLEGDAERLKTRSYPTVITPHPAELARLLGWTTREVQGARLHAVHEARERFGCVVLLKGYRTLIADPTRVVVNPTGGPELATAGTGDVLTGIVAALIAQGLDPFVATWAGAFAHGVAGTAATADNGAPVVALDVAEALPKAVATLRSQIASGS